MAAILPKGPKHPGTIGGSPRGWTFISSAKCWRQWALRYLLGFFPVLVKAYFDLGSAFHAFMEGQPADKVAASFPEQVEEAKRLAKLRQEKGPPLGKAIAVEQEYALFGGKMTSKPDREEVGRDGKRERIRDYKSAFNFSEHDDKYWNVDPGILGEIMAGGVTKGIVDIVTKREKADGTVPEKPVKLVEVTLTGPKAKALEQLVDDFWEQLEDRVRRVAGGEPADDAFPPNLSACVGKYGPCDYYDRCWGKPPESMLYRLADSPPRRWVTGRENAPLKLPGKLTVKLIDTAYKKAKEQFFGKGGLFT